MRSPRKLKTLFVLELAALVAIGFLVVSALTSHTTSINTPSSKSVGFNYQSETTPAPSSSSTQPSTITPSPSTSTPTPGIPTASQSIGDVTGNWAGYAATSGTYSGVSGSWTVPQATGSDETSADATWIGIGGANSDDLIQVGTQNIVSPNGQVSTSAFYELLPDASVSLPGVTVNEGDEVSASIEELGNSEWTITFDDITTGSTYTIPVSYDSSLSSVEWIEEDPSDGNSQIPLDNFTGATFTAGSAVDNDSTVSIAGSGAQALTMINDSGEDLTSVSSLGNNGSSFTVSRTDAPSGPAISQFNQDPGSWIRQGSGLGGQYGNWQALHSSYL